jgi:PAS domain S-box-containing protein/diguanylate cyclase (GGDEF)-like protein
MARLGEAARRALERRRLRVQQKDALRELRRLAAIVENANDAIISRSLDGIVTSWNGGAERTFGYSAAEAVGRPIAELILPPEERARVDRNIERVRGGGVVAPYETQRLTKDGRPIDVLSSVSPIRNEAGEIVGAAVILRDISERKRAEAHLRRANRARQMIADCNQLLVREGSEQRLLDEVCRIAVERGGYRLAWVGYREHDAALSVRPVAQAGASDGYVEGARITWGEGPRGEGPTGRAIRTATTQISRDIAGDAGAAPWREDALRRGYRGSAALPLIENGAAFGVLNVYTAEPNVLDTDEVGLLEAFAGDLAYGICAIRERAARRKADVALARLNRVLAVLSAINSLIVRVRDRDTLFREACRIAVHQGDFGIAWIGAFDAERLEVTPVAIEGLPAEQYLGPARVDVREGAAPIRSVVGVAIRERRPVHVNDISVNAGASGARMREAIRRGYRSVIALPLMTDGGVVGSFSLYARELNFFNDDEVKLLTELASNISFALEHMARREKIDRLTRVRAVSGGINAAIVRIKDRRDLYREVCRIAVEQGGFGMAWVSEFDPASEDVTPVAWAGEGVADHVAYKTTARTDTPLGHGVVGRAIRAKKPVVCNDLTAEMDVGSPRRRLAFGKGFRSLAGLPLIVDGDVAATVTLYAREARFFDEEEMALLSEVAGNISFALENMAKQEKIDKLSRIRAVSSEINAAIVRVRDRQSLFEETCRIAAQYGRFALCWIAEIDVAGRSVQPVAWRGFTEEGARAVTWDLMQNSGGSMVEAIDTRRPTVRNRMADRGPEGTLRNLAMQKGCRSFMTLPLVVEDRVVAIITLFATEENFFDEEELGLLRQVGEDLSYALASLAKQEQLDYLSYYDPLTGLPNRSLFLDRLGQQLHERSGDPSMVALILLDVERIRYVNETLGRHAGDELLRLVARRLENGFQGKEHIARVGGDGFGIVTRGLRDAAGVLHVVESRALACFREPFLLDGTELRVSGRAGIAVFPTDGADADTLFKNAEAALDRASRSGEPYLFYAADMNARVAHALLLESRLRRAVEARQFVLHYQPKVALGSGAVCGLEALIRWRQPDGTLVPPDVFIPLLEETGLILEVGRWAIATALEDRRAWIARGCAVPRIAVNVSSKQLERGDFVETVVAAVREAGDSPDVIELEVTESLLMRDVQASIGKLSRLRGLGVQVAIDDFGTGYSSLAYLARLPIGSLKIDRSFVNAMTGGEQDTAIISTIIALAHSLKLKVVAEGVENRNQARMLASLRCDEAQGFFYSKPQPAPEIEALLKSDRRFGDVVEARYA